MHSGKASTAGAVKTHCPQGHQRVPENLRPGRRDCAICHREQELARRRARGVKPRQVPDACPQGHPNIPENRRKKGDCLVCHREQELARYKANIEASRKIAREYARQHKAEARERHRKWRAANVEYVRATARDAQRRRSLGRNTEAIAFAAIIRNDPCCYCGAPTEDIDHIVPICGYDRHASAFPNTWDNLTAACARCNRSKRAKPLLRFLLTRRLAS